MPDLSAISLLIAKAQGKDRKSGIAEAGENDALREIARLPNGAQGSSNFITMTAFVE
jgi:hypothetical protein